MLLYSSLQNERSNPCIYIKVNWAQVRASLSTQQPWGCFHGCLASKLMLSSTLILRMLPGLLSEQNFKARQTPQSHHLPPSLFLPPSLPQRECYRGSRRMWIVWTDSGLNHSMSDWRWEAVGDDAAGGRAARASVPPATCFQLISGDLVLRAQRFSSYPWQRKIGLQRGWLWGFCFVLRD